MKRLLIYSFSGQDGRPDSYVRYILSTLLPFCSGIVFASQFECNFKIIDNPNNIEVEYITTEKEKLLLFQYETLIDQIGKERLCEYDEVVFVSDEIMGPVGSFKELFSNMESSNIDAWSISKRDGFLNSDFLAVRKRIFESDVLCNKKVFSSEKKFTKSLAAAGFNCIAFADAPELNSYSPDNLLCCPIEMLEKYRCPIFEKRSFSTDYHELLEHSTGNQGRELLRYLKNKTDYNTDYIWEHILRTENMADIRSCLNLCYVLSKKEVPVKSRGSKVALVMHEHYPDLIDYCHRYSECFGNDADIIITAGSEEIKQELEKKYSEQNSVQIIFGRNRGRDIRSLLIEANPFLKEYDLVCYVHDKKSSQQEYGVTGFSYMDRCFENLLGSKELVENITALFENEPRLGMLCVPTPNHSRYYDSLGGEWGPNYENIKDLAKKLGLDVPMSPNKEPISPFGTMFWFRPEAMTKILDYKWSYEDFPEEPVDVDGTILHAIERIYTFVAQDAGYYTANVLNSDFAMTEIINLEFMLRNLNVELLRKYGRATNKKMVGYIHFPGLRRLYPPMKKLMPADMRKKLKGKWTKLKREKRIKELNY